MIFCENAVVKENRKLTDGIYSMLLECKKTADSCVPGQFINMYTKDKAHLLPRPISICDSYDGCIRVVFRVVGFGTNEFAEAKAGDIIRIEGPNGNGFPVEKGYGRTVLLMGGGIGAPPLLKLAKALKGHCDLYIINGYRTNDLFLNDDFEAAAPGKVFVSTDDGTAGTKGTVIDALKALRIKPDIIYSCGPMPMLKGIAAYAKETGSAAYVSLEERMACGIGACLGCVVKTKKKDNHTNVNNARICKEGPVFFADELDF